jgi:outer membrane receptor protein involved in Fe transport
VVVNIDRITQVEVELQEEILEGEVITVEATREAVEFDRTNSTSYVSKDQIQAMPVKNVSDVVQLQAGVVQDANGGIHIRGGRTREVAYMIDGISVTNNFSQGGGSNVRMENNFIQELQVITGTFNAEYGQAQSGIINVVTKVPEETYDVMVDFLTGGYYSTQPQYIGLDTYDPFGEMEMNLSLSGPIPFPKSLGRLGFYVNGRFLDSQGYLQGQRRFNTTDGWEIEVYREWYDATYDPKDPLVIPIPDSLHTGDGETVPMDWSKLYNVNTKLVYQPSNSITVAYNMFYSKTDGKYYSNSWRFAPEGTSQYHTLAMTHMATWTHTPWNNFFYNLRYSYQQNEYETYAFEDANDPMYQQTAVNAWDPGKNTGYDYGGINSWDRNFYDQKTHLFNGDATWQINNIVELKGGFEVKKYNLSYTRSPMREVLGYETLQFPYTRNEIRGLEIPYLVFREATRDFQYGNIRLRETSADSLEDAQFFVDYDRFPIEGSGYLQTTLSMGDIILNAGMRLDVFMPQDRYAPDYSIVFPEFVGADVYYEKAKTKYQVSPRFGLSFPISTKGAIRLSYGHFFQMPSMEKLYQNPVLEHYNQFSIMDSYIGNPNLDAEKTVQYEAGLQQELIPGLSLELSVFYKDIRDLLGVEILTLSNATTFYRYINKEYGNSSGFTLAFNQATQDGTLQSAIDYTYMTAKGTSSSAEAIREVSVTSGPGAGAYTMASRRVDFLNWDQTHSLNAVVNYIPAPTWLVSVIGQWGSGLPYSPATLDPSVEIPGGWWDNADRKPTRWTVDLKLGKSFRVWDSKIMFYIDIYNLFDHANENHVSAITGRAGPNAYLPELGRSRYRRIDQIGEFSRTEADYNPTQYSKPRLIQFGANLSF